MADSLGIFEKLLKIHLQAVTEVGIDLVIQLVFKIADHVMTAVTINSPKVYPQKILLIGPAGKVLWTMMVMQVVARDAQVVAQDQIFLKVL
jgi:hypothetical protein